MARRLRLVAVFLSFLLISIYASPVHLPRTGKFASIFNPLSMQVEELPKRQHIRDFSGKLASRFHS